VAGRKDQDSQADGVARLGDAAKNDSTIRKHLDDVIHSDAFKSSQRCQLFLVHVVTRALHGDFDGLKERSIGVELFGRPASYDTAEDAIVRVTASDVRKRLLQYYGRAGVEPPLRIGLPTGSYAPEFRGVPNAPVPQAGSPAVVAEVPAAVVAVGARRRVWIRLAGVCLSLCAAFVVGVWVSPWIWQRPAAPALRMGPPWPNLFREGRPTHLVVSDTDIALFQNLLGRSIPLSDYANRQYLAFPDSTGPEARRILGHLVARDYSAATAVVDIRAALRIAEFAQSYAHQLDARSARMMRLQDFDTDDDFILLGSPLSNPWTGLFQEHLDFVFEFDKASGKEVCRNLRPREGESALYDPTATMFKTGNAFAIVAFLANRDHAGHVLIIAGSNAEATEGAAKFITNPELVSGMLSRYKLGDGNSCRDFEVLLGLRTMAGAPGDTQLIAVHDLGPAGKTGSSR
jgi:hypothetical protein